MPWSPRESTIRSDQSPRTKRARSDAVVTRPPPAQSTVGEMLVQSSMREELARRGAWKGIEGAPAVKQLGGKLVGEGQTREAEPQCCN